MSRWASALKAFNQKFDKNDAAHYPTLIALPSLPDLNATAPNSQGEVIERESSQIDGSAKTNASSAIPPLFPQGRSPISPLEQRMVRYVRQRTIEQIAATIPTDSMLDTLWQALLDNETTSSSPSADSEGEMLNYRDFGLATQALPLIRKLVSPAVFAAFPRDSLGRVSARLLYRYCSAFTNRLRLKVTLLPFDSSGTGILSEADLDAFVQSQLSQFPAARSLGADFLPYYTFQVTRKFVFFLDPGRRSRIPISRLVDSPLLQEFMNLRNTPARTGLFDHLLASASLLGGLTPGSRPVRLTPRDSWFHPARALSVYSGYLKLDADRNGMLSSVEFSGAGSGLLSPLFVQRVFEEVQMFPPPSDPETDDDSMERAVSKEMDYKTYIDFILAYYDMSMPQSIRYFFRFLDMKHQGYIDESVIRLFIRDVIEVVSSAGHELNPSLLVTMCSEYFDLVRPKVPGRVTVEDLINCRSASHAIGLLIDGRGLLNYESREGKCAIDPDNLGDDFLR